MQNIENLTLKDLLNADFSAMDEDMVTSIAFKIGTITSNLTDSIRHRNKSDTERLAVFSKTITKSGISAFNRNTLHNQNWWPSNEVSFRKDRDTFVTLADNEQKLLEYVFSIFAVGDGAINNSIFHTLRLVAPTPEDEMFYTTQAHNEDIHAIVYGNILKHLFVDDDKIQEVQRYPETCQSLQRVMKYLDDLTKVETLRSAYVFNAIAERLIFSSLFAVIFWFRAYRQGHINKIVIANELIMRDENLHGIQSCVKYNELREDQKYEEKEIQEVMENVIEMMDDFIVEILGDISLPELTPKNFKSYVRFVADDLLAHLGHEKIFNTKQPFTFMKMNELDVKTNFFEGEVGNYSRYSLEGIEKIMMDLENNDFTNSANNDVEDSELIY